MTVSRLTRPQLSRYIHAELIRPQRTEQGFFFVEVDIARLELLCDLSEDLELNEAAIKVVISLVDQLHETRRDLTLLADAIETLPSDLRSRINAAIQKR